MANDNQLAENTTPPIEPGTTITPGVVYPSASPAVPSPDPVAPVVVPEPLPASPMTSTTAPEAPAQLPVSTPLVTGLVTEPASPPSPALFEDAVASQGSSDGQSMEWTASEADYNQKGMWWYLVLAAIIVVLVATAVIFKLWLGIGVFVVMGVAIAIFAQRGPHTQSYMLDEQGLTVEGKLYPYDKFKSFGVIADPSWHAIDLESTSRVMPRLNILYNDSDFDAIVDILTAVLPREDRSPDLIERLTRWLRF